MAPFLLCSAPLRALDVVTQQGSGLSEIAFIHALLRQSRTRSARRYHGPYLVVAQYCMSRRSLVAQIYGGQRKLVAADRLADRVCDQLLIMHEPVRIVPHMGVLGAVDTDGVAKPEAGAHRQGAHRLCVRAKINRLAGASFSRFQ